MLDQFECVRIVRMNGLDLNQFQFDYDQTWAVMFFRHDGTVLARYGTRAASDGMKYNSLAGFKDAMRTVLDVEGNWQPKLQELYAAKRGPTVQHATPEEIPSDTIRKIEARKQNARQNCVHCHNIYDARRDYSIASGDYDPATRYKYPMPTNIGVDIVERTTIASVSPDSPAAAAGMKPDTSIVRMNGQNVHTLADIQFALHHTSDPGEVTIETSSASGQEQSHSLKLAAGWRKSDIGWRASMYGMPPRLGLWVQELDDAGRAKAQVADGKLALLIRGVFGKEVRQHGLKKDDIILRFAGQDARQSEQDFHSYVRLNCYRPGSELPLHILRGGKPMDVTVQFPNPQ